MAIFEGFDPWNLLDGLLGALIATLVAVWYARHSESAKEKNAKDGMRRIVKADLSFFETVLTNVKGSISRKDEFLVVKGMEPWSDVIGMFDAADRFDRVPLELRAQYFDHDLLELIHNIYRRIKGYRSSEQETEKFNTKDRRPYYPFKVPDVEDLLAKIQQAKSLL